MLIVLMLFTALALIDPKIGAALAVGLAAVAAVATLDQLVRSKKDR